MCVQSKKLFNVCAVWYGVVWYGVWRMVMLQSLFMLTHLSVIKWTEMCVFKLWRFEQKKFSLYLFWLLLLLTYWRWKYLKAKCRDIHSHIHNWYCVALHHFYGYDAAICLRLWFNCQQYKYHLFIWSINIEEPPHSHAHTPKHIAITLFQLTLKSSSYLWSCSRFRLPLSINLHQVGMDCPIRTPCCKNQGKNIVFSLECDWFFRVFNRFYGNF